MRKKNIIELRGTAAHGNLAVAGKVMQRVGRHFHHGWGRRGCASVVCILAPARCGGIIAQTSDNLPELLELGM